MESNVKTPETTLRVQSVVYPPNWEKNRENKAMHFLNWMVKIQNIHYSSQERMSNAIEKINTQQ
jgi:alcohol dehydrogenase YqhD (iron-dependent ADH family)